MTFGIVPIADVELESACVSDAAIAGLEQFKIPTSYRTSSRLTSTLSVRACGEYPGSAGDCAEWRCACAGGYAVHHLALLIHAHAGDARHGRAHVRVAAFHVYAHGHGLR